MKDITGTKYGRLEAVRFHSRTNGITRWLFRCDCGVEKVLIYANVTGGSTISCGCYLFEMLSKSKSTHGLLRNGALPREYKSWNSLKERCLNQSHKQYPDYGGRGIGVCERWLKFENFLADLGPCPDGFTIERIDVNGNYEPKNCKWISKALQNRNKRNTVRLTLNGKTLPLMEWVELTGLSEDTIRQRKSNGMSDEEALTKPARITNRSRRPELSPPLSFVP